MQPFREALTKTWKSTGQPITENIFDGEMNGLTHSVNTIYKGQHSGSYLALIDKPNVTILSGVHSKRLLVDNADCTCKGVSVIDASANELSFYANREVVVSQGVFESPKPLILSGIGPAHELAKRGIDAIVDSPHVSQHLLDHPWRSFRPLCQGRVWHGLSYLA